MAHVHFGVIRRYKIKVSHEPFLNTIGTLISILCQVSSIINWQINTLQIKLINIEIFAMTLKEWQILENIKTLSELAIRLKVAESSNPSRLVQRWVNGSSFPRKHHLHSILKATNGKVTANDFLTQ